VIDYHVVAQAQIRMILIYRKGIKDDLTPKEKSVITLKAPAEAALRERPAQVFVLVALPGRPGDRELA
jgi:hypothetical protein